MSSCKHKTLVLLESKPRKRCRHCHLTLTADELGEEGFCPECFETHGTRRFDFDDVQESGNDQPQYVCDECGVHIG